MVLHERAKKIRNKTRHRFTGKQLGEAGRRVIKRYRELHGNPNKIQVFLKNKDGKEYYWWLADYPESFFPELDRILIECATEILIKKNRKKRPRIQKKLN